jgi:hypothetical protein
VSEKLICYFQPKRFAPLDNWDLKTKWVDEYTMTTTIKYGKRSIVLNSTSRYLKVDAEKTGATNTSGTVDCEFFDANWRELGLL